MADQEVLDLLTRVEDRLDAAQDGMRQILKILKPPERKSKYVPSRDAINCVRAWNNYRPLAEGWEKKLSGYAKVFDLLHTRDHVPWEGTEGIHGICVRAVTVWEAKWIQSPSALRRESKSRAPLKTWEVLRQQIRDDQGDLGDSDPTLRGI